MTAVPSPVAAKQTRSMTDGLGTGLSVLGAVVLSVAAMFLPVVQSSDATTTGYAIRHHEQELADLNARTYNLQAEVAQLGSVARIQQGASRLGMVPASRSAASVAVTDPVPATVLLPRRYVPPLAAVPEPQQHGLVWEALHVLGLR